MTVIGNRFTPAFAGRRPDGPTPAPPGPDVRILGAAINNRTVSFRLAVDDADLDTVVVDWGDQTPREPLDPPWTSTHTYPDDAAYEIRAVARSTAGRESLSFVVVQVGAHIAAPIPDPVADFTITPAAPTTADNVSLDAAPSTPAEHIDGYEWRQMMPAGGISNVGPILNLGTMLADNYVFSLRVRLPDGRWSSVRQRGFAVTAPEIEEPDK